MREVFPTCVSIYIRVVTNFKKVFLKMLKMSLKIEQSQISRRIWGIPLIFGLFMLINSCDVCNTSSPDGGNSSEKIYYTAISANNTTPDIYSVNKNGTGISKLISDGIVFSSPSNDLKICFLRKNDEGIGELLVYNPGNGIYQSIVKGKRIV